MKISPARAAAFQILSKIDAEHAHSSALLDAFETRLQPVDRGLCHEITLGVLRRQIKLDRIIDVFAGGRKLDSAVRLILRIGLYQLLHLDRIPAHAAINDAVNMTQNAKKTSAKGFVNALLRRATRETAELKFTDEIDRVCVETSHPRWLVENWITEFGLEKSLALAESNNVTPPVSFRFTSKTTEAVRSSVEASPDDRAFLKELAAAGKIYFQDEGSQLVGSAVELKVGETFLDVCAAPGSKTSQIAASSPGSTLVAGDVSPTRAALLRDNCVRQGNRNVSVVRYDAANALPFADGSFDVVLVDAPCSGTGTIRHNPEIRYLIGPDDIAGLASKQIAILTEAARIVRPVGRLIYSTCSLEKAENEEVCEVFLDRFGDFRPSTPNVAERFLTTGGFARTFPPTDGVDGFFIAQFEKTAESGKF